MDTKNEKDNRMKWWREARFGMMIHWGLYSIPAGEWKGQKMNYIGEWLMSKYRIPIKEYEKLADSFNPADFDADQWVRLAKQAGMKYILFTSKHHDGFAMYKSENDPYNIVDATPFRRDPVAELAASCQQHGLKLCLYYSQALDWHEKDAGGTEPGTPLNFGMSWGNDWDFPDYKEKDFSRFFEKKVKPQVREILTKYGPVGMIWFDCPNTITRPQSEELYNFVRELQDGCIINSRIGNGLGDYSSFCDNELPSKPMEGDWETIATMNDTWGYKHFDHNWKTPEHILNILTGLAGRGINYLLNVGPTAKGAFPEESVKILNEVGAWMEKNSESVHGVTASPFVNNFNWGTVAAKHGKLYLHINKWQGNKISLNGLHNKVIKAYMLPEKDVPLSFAQNYDDVLNLHSLDIELPGKYAKETIPVAVVEFEGGNPDVEKGLFQQGDKTVYLPAYKAAIHKDSEKSDMCIYYTGPVYGWYNEKDWLSWDFKVYEKGRYTIKITTSALFHSNPWIGGHKIRIESAGQEIRSIIQNDKEEVKKTSGHYSCVTSICGEIFFDSPGIFTLALKTDEINKEAKAGFAVTEVRLVSCPVQMT